MLETRLTLPKNARPFYHIGGNTGILLLHGFTGTPYVFRELGRKLAKNGYTVIAPLLTGHGTSPEEMAGTTWEDWCKSALTSFDHLSLECQNIYIIGGSFGSSIACYLATVRKVEGLVLIGTPLWINGHWLLESLSLISSLLGIQYFENSFNKKLNKTVLFGGPTFSYGKIPVKSIREFLFFNRMVRSKFLGLINVPTLIVQSKKDGLVNPTSGTQLFSGLATVDKELVWIEDQHDNLHNGTSKDYLFRLISDFISRVKQPTRKQ